jgi:peptidoglycan hydrolase-like protein with peptidoglycan-binding domain
MRRTFLLVALAMLGVIGITPGVASAAATATAADIRLAQTDLNGLDYNAGTVDGVVGPQTRAATSAFQNDQCLTVDGVIGSDTLGRLKTVVGQVQTAVGVTADGDYALSTINAVKAFQTAHNLDVDGIVGPDTEAALGIERLVASCHSPSGTGATVVQIAKNEIGTVADANRCVPGKPYSICNEWCAAFATWVWRTAGIDIPKINYVPSVYDWAVAHNKWYGTGQLSLAQPGYLIIFGSANNRYHIGVVDHVSGSTVFVISGNTTNPSKPSQYGVFDKSYALSGSVFYGLVHF